MPQQRPRRSSGQTTRDGQVVRRQVDRMRNTVETRAFQSGLFDLIRQDLPGRAPFDVGRIYSTDGFLVAVSGDILVRTRYAARAARLLPGFAPSTIGFLDDRVTQFSRPGTTVQQASNLVRQLRNRNIQATVNYVVPLGYVAKGEGGFENTTVDPSDQGPGDQPGGGPKVAVIDTGITDEHRTDGWLTNIRASDDRFDPLYLPGQSAPDGILDFSAGHGTFVSGIIQQVAPEADICVYNPVRSNGIGSELEIAKAVLDAAEAGAEIINLSLGTETEFDARPVGLDVTMELLAERHPDVLLVAAAGNSGRSAPTWPAAFPEVIAVAGLTAAQQPTTWSSFGPWVDVSAIAEGVVSTYVCGQESIEVDKESPDKFDATSWAVGTGTSFAAPQVTGAVAAELAKNGGTPQEAFDRFLAATSLGSLPGYGAVVEILEGTPAI